MVDQVLKGLELGLLHDVHHPFLRLDLIVHDAVLSSHCQAADVGTLVVNEERSRRVLLLLEEVVCVRVTRAA